MAQFCSWLKFKVVLIKNIAGRPCSRELTRVGCLWRDGMKYNDKVVYLQKCQHEDKHLHEMQSIKTRSDFFPRHGFFVI